MSADQSDLPSRASLDQNRLDQIRRRDPEALAEAVQNHSRPLWKAARALGFSEHDAEDLVHDVFTTFLERIDKFEGRSQLRTWLFGILYRKAMERRRASAREEATDPIDSVFDSAFDKTGKWVRPPADLNRLMLSKELGEIIQGCMEGLTVNQRAAFVLKEMEDLDAAGICKILEVSATNYGVLMHRARVRLRECLEAKGWKR